MHDYSFYWYSLKVCSFMYMINCLFSLPVHVSNRLYSYYSQVWMVVQRKWMYLESIFIGGDIRAQLPEEAKKFDAIDKTFKKVIIIVQCSALLEPNEFVVV